MFGCGPLSFLLNFTQISLTVMLWDMGRVTVDLLMVGNLKEISAIACSSSLASGMTQKWWRCTWGWCFSTWPKTLWKTQSFWPSATASPLAWFRHFQVALEVVLSCRDDNHTYTSKLHEPSIFCLARWETHRSEPEMSSAFVDITPNLGLVLYLSHTSDSFQQVFICCFYQTHNYIIYGSYPDIWPLQIVCCSSLVQLNYKMRLHILKSFRGYIWTLKC